ncbi:glycerol-3-phosphate dehydrogenase/oxidase [Planctomycetota bacterium]
MTAEPSANSTAAERREQAFERLSADTFDVLIVGGGIAGAGAAREAARRGLRTALVERQDLASGTSSRSSKLVHGGLRYLEQFAFSLVFEAVSERRVLQDIAPHLVRPLPFLFPIYASSGRSPFVIDVGMWIYDALSLFRSPRLHRKLRPRDVLLEEPRLLAEELRGASLYYDCATDDGRLTLETAIDAALAGAVVCTYATVTELKEAGGRACGAIIRDGLSDRICDVSARSVINTTGPWTDALRGQATPLVRPTKGIHIVVDHERLPVNHAVVLTHPEDRRALFAIPWGDRTYVGTTDTDYDGDPGEVCADAEDVSYCLDAANRFFPDVSLVTDDVISTWAALRPLIAEEGMPSSLSREHVVLVEPNGLVTLAGGKLTTYRRMAIDVVEQALSLLRITGKVPELKSSKTDAAQLPGGEGWPDDDDVATFSTRVAESSGGHLSPGPSRHLAEVYGGRALELARRVATDPSLGKPIIDGRPEIWAQVDWACDEELAQTVLDVLVRRTTIFLKSRCQGLSALDAVSDRMAIRLGWDGERVQQERERYRAEVARSRRWREA